MLDACCTLKQKVAMGEINLSRAEKDALTGVDADIADQAIKRAVESEKIDGLYQLQLTECGAYVAAQYSTFQRALTKHKQSKSAKKVVETLEDLRRAGARLASALRQMKRRAGDEEEEGKLFRVHDDVFQPPYVGAHMNVTVSYQWRKSIDDQWNYGSITFDHVAEFRPDYSVPASKRKPSSARQREEREERLRREWEYLMRGALYSVQAYFREGRDGSSIPKRFRAVIDDHSRCLNNYSTQFWREHQ